MQRFSTAILLSALCFAIGQRAVGQQAAVQPASSADHAEKAWIQQSNDFTNMLLKVQLEHSPERGSQQGLAAFDERISDPSRADQAAERRELEAALGKIKTARSTVADKNVQEDIDILQKSFNLQTCLRGTSSWRVVCPSPMPAPKYFRVCADCSMIRCRHSGVRRRSRA